MLHGNLLRVQIESKVGPCTAVRNGGSERVRVKKQLIQTKKSCQENMVEEFIIYYTNKDSWQIVDLKLGRIRNDHFIFTYGQRTTKFCSQVEFIIFLSINHHILGKVSQER